MVTGLLGQRFSMVFEGNRQELVVSMLIYSTEEPRGTR
jgi:hypothetical protein